MNEKTGIKGDTLIQVIGLSIKPFKRIPETSTFIVGV